MKKNLLLFLLFPILVFGFGPLVTKQIDVIDPESGAITLKDTVIIDGGSTDSVMYLNGSKELTSTSITPTELSYLDGVNENIQTALDSKLETADLTSDVSGTLPIANGGTNSTSALLNDLVMISNAGSIIESTITATELNYLDGVTQNIQIALDAGGGGGGANLELSNLIPFVAGTTGAFATFSGIPAGAIGTVTLTADTIGTVGNSITVTGASSGGATDEEVFAPSLATIQAYNVGTATLNNYNAAYPFSPTTSGNINNITIGVAPEKGGVVSVPSDGQMKAYLYDATGSGGAPNILLATSSTTLIPSDFSGDTNATISLKTFDFSFSVVSGTTYNLVVDYQNFTGDTATDWDIGADARGTTPPYNYSRSTNDGSSWATLNNVWFYIKWNIGTASNKDINTLIGEWNVSNPANTATINAGGTETPDIGEIITLINGADNVSSSGVAINTDLIPDINLTHDIGGGLMKWNNLFAETIIAPTISGNLKIIDGTEGTIGHVWTSTDANGAGSWQPATGGGSTYSTYSARLSAAGVVSRETGDWLNGNCTIANCTINVGIFSNIPNCTLTAVALDDICIADATTTGNVNVPCYENGSGNINNGIGKTLICHGD